MKPHHFTLALLAIVIISGSIWFSQASAQFVPPKLSPGCNPSSPNCNIAPPLNVGEQFQEKKSNLFIRLPSSWNTGGQLDATWDPNPAGNTTSGSPTIFGLDTNGWIRGWNIRATNELTVGPLNGSAPAGKFFLPYAKSTLTAPLIALGQEQPLCIATHGYVYKCTNTIGGSSTGGTTTDPAPIVAPTASLTVSPQSINSGNSVSVTWSSKGATRCVPAHGPKNFDFYNGEKNGTLSVSNVVPPETFSIVCSNDNTGLATTAVARVNPVGVPIVDLRINNSDNTLVLNQSNYTSSFTVNKIITGGAPLSCVQWTTWGTEAPGSVDGEDPDWRGTEFAPKTSTGQTHNTSPVNILPINTEDPLHPYRPGFRTYWLRCSNTSGSTTDSITVEMK